MLFQALTDFLTSSTGILIAMGFVALVEFFNPLQAPGARGRRVSVNLALTVFTLALSFLLSMVLVALLLNAPLRDWSLVSFPASVPAWGVLIFTVFILDFATWVAHWGLHKVPFLWRLHLVHHTDELVDVTTSYRQHPLEGLWRIFVIAIFAVGVGASAEAFAVYRMLSAVNALLEHGNFRTSRWIDRWLSPLWVTPNFHKLHHSARQVETDSNYGNLFSFFDRLFGTYSPPQGAVHVTYGIDEYKGARSYGLSRTLKIPFEREPAEQRVG